MVVNKFTVFHGIESVKNHHKQTNPRKLLEKAARQKVIPKGFSQLNLEGRRQQPLRNSQRPPSISLPEIDDAKSGEI